MILKDFKQNIELKPKTSFFHRKKQKTKYYPWQGTKKNPYKREPDSDKKKMFFYIFIISLSFILTIFLMVFHPFFKITEINVKGLQRIGEADIKTVTFDILNLKSLGFLPNDSYFRVNTEDVADVLKNRFPIEEIHIEKTFPNHLNIEIQEKITTIIYDNGEEYCFINLKGEVVEIFRKVASYEWQEKTQTVTSTDEFGEVIEKEEVIERIHKPDIKNLTNAIGNYPVVFDEREQEIEINNNVLDPKQTEKIIDWYNLLNKTDINLKYFIIDNSLNQIIIQTFDGWYIKSSINREVDTQYKEFTTVLEQEIKNSDFNYVDLRYNDRIYWK